MTVAPSFVSAGWSSHSVVGGHSLNVGLPAGVVPGNLLIAAYQSTAVLANLGAPPGWQLGDLTPSGLGFWIYKVADGTETDPITVTWTGTNYLFGQAILVQGALASRPIGALTEQSSNISPIFSDGFYSTAPDSLAIIIVSTVYDALLPAPSGFALLAQSAADYSGLGWAITFGDVAITNMGDPSPATGLIIANGNWCAFQIEVLADAANTGVIASTLGTIKQLVGGADIGGGGTGNWYSWWMQG